MKVYISILLITLVTLCSCRKFTWDNLNDTTNPSTSPASLKNGLVAYYPFNGNADDESGNSNHGSVSGALLASDRFGNNNSAYKFLVNTSDRIVVPVLPKSTNWTIAFWFLPTTNNINRQNYLIAFKCQGLYSGIGLTYSQPDCSQPTNKSFIYDGVEGCSNVLTSNLSYNQNQYNFLVVSYINGEYKLSINSNSFTSSKGLKEVDLSSIIIGRRCLDAPEQTFDGNIDDIRIYNRALTQEEITYLANN